MAFSYEYTISTAFPHQKVCASSLQAQVAASAIVTAVKEVTTQDDLCTVTFAVELSSGDKTILDGVVAAHDGEPYPSPVNVKLLGPCNPEDKLPVMAVAPREGNELLYATHNFCDETTWYWESERVTDEVLSDSGDGFTFESDHGNWIDLDTGKVFDQEGIREDGETFFGPGFHQWKIIVKVDDVEKTAREPLEESGGDYTIDYVNGKVTFAASQSGKTVKASYSYAAGSKWILRPTPGKAIDMESAEAQFSSDAEMTDTFDFVCWGWVQVFAPELWEGYDPPGPLPTNTLVPILTETYFRFATVIDNAYGSYPVLPAIGGPEPRGTQHQVYGMPFRYSTLRRLWAKYGMELSIGLRHDRVFGGERVTVTFYCVSKDESSIG